MIEFTTLVTLCVLYLIFFRNGKTPPLQNPLVVERAGKYHLTLAPQLNLAQPYLEAIAARLGIPEEVQPDSATHFFEVNDKATGGAYQLAITRRCGMLYFQAARPAAKSEPLQTIREFADAALAKIAGGEHVAAADDIAADVQHEANLRGITVKALSA